MAGKSIAYWKTKWNNSKKTDMEKALDLLNEYAGFKPLPILNYTSVFGGFLGRFFSGRWNTHHGSQVLKAIRNFSPSSFHLYSIENEYKTVPFLLAHVKKEIGAAPLNPEGDLARILGVIKNKTGVDYFALDAEKEIEKLEPKSPGQGLR